MKVSEIREELLAQHQGLRRLADRALDAARLCLAGEPDSGTALEAALDALGTALREHNVREEELLRRLLPLADAWGAARVAWMDRRHSQEHTRLLGAVMASGAGPEAAARVQDLVAEILAHIDREEEEILSPAVLSDEIARVDLGFGG